jgi:hypothetical protein
MRRRTRRRMTKEEFKQYVDYQTDILFDGDADEEGRVDIVSGLFTLAFVQVETFQDQPIAEADRRRTAAMVAGLPEEYRGNPQAGALR